MKRIRIDPIQYPKYPDEQWWIVHPNTANCEFRIPSGAITLCQKNLEVFKFGVAYNVISADNHNGWVTVEANGDLYDMPQYLFGRHFDAEIFVVGKASPVELENARPFDYKPTLPHKKVQEQLELFKG